MPRTLRRWITSGIVLASAGVIAAAPIVRPAPVLDVPQGSLQLSSNDLPFPLVDWTQFSNQATTNWDALLNGIQPGFTPDFSGLSYSPAALLIEAGMALKILVSPNAAGQAITGVSDQLHAALSGGHYLQALNILTNAAVPTILNGYLNGIPPTDGLLNAGISGTPPIPTDPPYESGNLLQMLVQTMTDESAYAHNPVLVTAPIGGWLGNIPPGLTAGDLNVDLPTAVQTLIGTGGPLNGLADYLGLSVDGNSLDIDIPTAITHLIAAGGPLNGLATDLGLSVNGNDLDINLLTALNTVWPVANRPDWLHITSPSTGVTQILAQICDDGANLLNHGCSYSFLSGLKHINVKDYIPGHNDYYAIQINNPEIQLSDGTPATIINFGPPASVFSFGDDYTAKVPQFDIDLAKDLLALFGQPTDLSWDIDLNNLLAGANLGLSIAGGDDLHINVTGLLAELFSIFH